LCPSIAGLNCKIKIPCEISQYKLCYLKNLFNCQFYLEQERVGGYSAEKWSAKFVRNWAKIASIFLKKMDAKEVICKRKLSMAGA
jgi:hypothetical protein